MGIFIWILFFQITLFIISQIFQFLYFRQLSVHKLLLYSNILETLPCSLFELKNLAELDLSNNVLCSIPEALGSELTNLTHLVLRNNMLTDTDFPKNMSGLANSLKYLNLSGNNLTCIPPPLLQLTGKRPFLNDVTQFWSPSSLFPVKWPLYLPLINQ